MALFFKNKYNFYDFVSSKNIHWRSLTKYRYMADSSLELNDIILRSRIMLQNQNELMYDKDLFLKKLKLIEDIAYKSAVFQKDLHFMQQIYKIMFLDVMKQQVLGGHGNAINPGLLSM